MEVDIKCANCGAVWRVTVLEGASIVAGLVECPLCKKAV